jgi:hypothetical protein
MPCRLRRAKRQIAPDGTRHTGKRDFPARKVDANHEKSFAAMPAAPRRGPAGGHGSWRARVFAAHSLARRHDRSSPDVGASGHSTENRATRGAVRPRPAARNSIVFARLAAGLSGAAARMEIS